MAVQTEKPPTADPAKAWAPYRPDAKRPWTLALAGHLYRRAAFGANWSELGQALADGPQETIDRLLHPPTDAAAFDHEYDQYDISVAGSESAEGLRAWWLRRMIHTPYPLQEKMTLFWHGHFATSNAEVKDARLMQRHVALLRSHALGRFRPLLEAISRDPAVLVWLGADANRKAMPNESFARAMLGTYTVGPGNYSDNDVRQAARGFTGRFVFGGKIRSIAREHDEGVKQILGQEGPFTGDEVVRIVLEHPATPRTLVRKLYRWLISEVDEPDESLIAPLADSLAEDYDVLKLVETMLRSELFFSSVAYRCRVKSPVEFALGIVRGLEGMVPTTHLAGDLASLGQNLYHPPTTKGWAGGRHWINDATLIGRDNLAGKLLAGTKPYGDKLDPRAVAEKYGHRTPEAAGRFFLDLFLPDDHDSAAQLKRLQASAASDTPGSLRRVVHATVTLPEFHLA